jgi:hypothetical protein
MAGLTLRSFINEFEKVVGQNKVQQALKLSKGSCADMEEYNRQVGRLEGMDQAVATLRDMLGQVEAAQANEDLPEMPQTGEVIQ